ncbi:uncharacterized protein E0L32_000129 [Thyridium curvatum]|uniref:Uncharacterized protein n=1 Tax=Thyridium curvatum TaxID=1093900 RepID=A0A507AYB7_9PEZI|nr:uncharacterized protein E0L32_000129 [Thyridium curvatum]TPX15795.1 hypothetical protein E0L32_000129 [Thyridium curvatum]
MPSPQEPMQQPSMTAEPSDVVSQQPSAEPQPEMMNLRGGEEAGCELCCGMCGCDESCC